MRDARKPLLIVEDDLALQKQMQWAFDEYETIVAADRDAAIVQLRRFEPSVVTMDLGLPPQPDSPVEGIKLLEEILTASPSTKVIVLTGQNDRENALKCISLGAYDFYEKPFEPEILGLTIARAYRLYELQEELRRLQAAQQKPSAGVITRDPEMLRICSTVEKIADTNATVLLLGESGTGKELLARALHESSSRSQKRFVAINCAAIPENLLESELFGFEKGAFTGAVKQTLGKFELAHEGTLFLDEIGDLPASLQAKLLRFLEMRTIERIGGRQEIPIDTRIVCATHRSLKEMIAGGGFREDLYYRLAEIVLDIPPLRERVGDAILLAHAFLRKFSKEYGRGTLTLLPDAESAIGSNPWPGNVRELENCIKRAVIMAEGSTLRASDFGLGAQEPGDDIFNLRQVRDRSEKEAVLHVLARVNGNMSRAAELLGISRPTLYDLINRFGLKQTER